MTIFVACLFCCENKQISQKKKSIQTRTKLFYDYSEMNDDLKFIIHRVEAMFQNGIVSLLLLLLLILNFFFDSSNSSS